MNVQAQYRAIRARSRPGRSAGLPPALLVRTPHDNPQPVGRSLPRRPNIAFALPSRWGGDGSSPVGPPLRQPGRSAGLPPALVVRRRPVNPTGQVVGRHKPVTDPRSGSSPVTPGNRLQARRAGIFVASPSQNRSKPRRCGIVMPPRARTERFPISRSRSGDSGERRTICPLPPFPFILHNCLPRRTHQFPTEPAAVPGKTAPASK
jgi:hypothetical protein